MEKAANDNRCVSIALEQVLDLTAGKRAEWSTFRRSLNEWSTSGSDLDLRRGNHRQPNPAATCDRPRPGPEIGIDVQSVVETPPCTGPAPADRPAGTGAVVERRYAPNDSGHASPRGRPSRWPSRGHGGVAIQDGPHPRTVVAGRPVDSGDQQHHVTVPPRSPCRRRGRMGPRRRRELTWPPLAVKRPSGSSMWRTTDCHSSTSRYLQSSGSTVIGTR
jgi:hypothetical protein